MTRFKRTFGRTIWHHRFSSHTLTVDPPAVRRQILYLLHRSSLLCVSLNLQIDTHTHTFLTHTPTFTHTHGHSHASLCEPQPRPVDMSVPVGYKWAIAMVTSLMSQGAGHLEVCRAFIFYILSKRSEARGVGAEKRR